MTLGSRDPYFLFHAGMIARRAGATGEARRLLGRLVAQSPRFNPLYGPGHGGPWSRCDDGPLPALAASAASLAGRRRGPDGLGALAHPLGNFTTNQLAQVRIDEQQARVHYVLDQAEIPTFQQVQRFDTERQRDDRGRRGGPLLDSELAEVASGLELAADGRPLSLGPPRMPELSFPPGQGGLLLTRVEVDFTAPLPRAPPGPARQPRLRRPDRLARDAGPPGHGTDVTSSVPATDPTDALRSYPQDLLSSPPDDLEASFEVRPGSGR